MKQKIYSKAFFYSNCFWAIPLLFLLSTPMSIPSNYDQQLRTTGHPPILIARLVRESKKRKKMNWRVNKVYGNNRFILMIVFVSLFRWWMNIIIMILCFHELNVGSNSSSFSNQNDTFLLLEWYIIIVS